MAEVSDMSAAEIIMIYFEVVMVPHEAKATVCSAVPWIISNLLSINMS